MCHSICRLGLIGSGHESALSRYTTIAFRSTASGTRLFISRISPVALNDWCYWRNRGHPSAFTSHYLGCGPYISGIHSPRGQSQCQPATIRNYDSNFCWRDCGNFSRGCHHQLFCRLRARKNKLIHDPGNRWALRRFRRREGHKAEYQTRPHSPPANPKASGESLNTPSGSYPKRSNDPARNRQANAENSCARASAMGCTATSPALCVKWRPSRAAVNDGL